jgi:ketosteroid isomerase-like protein
VATPLGTTFRGGAGIKEFQLGWATAFPDSRVEIRTLTVDGDRVIVEHNGRGTHRGPLVTPNGTVPATGRPVDVPFCEVFERRDGRVASARTYFDVATMMGQLGLRTGRDSTRGPGQS